tara:strand:- start:1234 stop:1470 length:237 start_codon:yes stop_codon:yes gene_type:complete
MSRIHVDDIYDKEGTGAPSLPAGVVVTGVATATSFSGNLTGDATGLSGTPDITVGTISATTYEGVPEGTNVLKAMLFS